MRTNLRITAWRPGSSYAGDAAATRRAEKERQSAQGRLTLHEQAVLDLELKLQIDTRWTPADERFKDVEEYLQRREFYQALSKLQGLIVQRLFELQKARVPGMSAFC